MDFTYGSGAQTRFLYHSKNIAIIVTWNEWTPDQKILVPRPTVELIIGQNDIEVSSDGRVTSIPFAAHPVKYIGDTKKIDIGDNSLMWLLPKKAIKALHQARTLFKEKDALYDGYKREILKKDQ